MFSLSADATVSSHGAALLLRRPTPLTNITKEAQHPLTPASFERCYLRLSLVTSAELWSEEKLVTQMFLGVLLWKHQGGHRTKYLAWKRKRF